MLAYSVFSPASSAAQDQEDTPQIPPREWKVKKKNDQGPRALGLLQLSSNGKATLIPIAIRIDGKFYDATAYKADPVPMALDSGIVYEGERSGNSVGLFTLNGALRSIAANAPHPWIGTGMWLAAGAETPKTGFKAETVPVGIEPTDAPPRLTKAGSRPTDDSKAKTAPASPPPASPQGSKPSAETQTKQEPAKPAPPADSKAPNQKETASADTGTSRGDDSYRPRLRRGKPTEPLPGDEDVPGYRDPKKAGSAEHTGAGAKSAGASWKAVDLIPAISDAGGPDPRSYAFDWDKGEAENRRRQMLALASDQVLAYVANEAKARIVPQPATPKAATARKLPGKTAQPLLENVQLRTFDLWANNQPVLVLSADAHMPTTSPRAGGSPGETMSYTITLVARTDIYSNLHALYTGITDKYHLDVTPRLELIDAVDADGDGRGELLFEETSDARTGYVIYRATTDKLWKLFDSLNPE